VQLRDGNGVEKEEKSMMFSAEMSSLMQLDHPNIVRMYDVFTTERFFVLILEYCVGGDLGKEIYESGRLTINRFLSVAREIAIALACCHSMKIAHRDVKPTNVLFDNYGRVKLADFGLAIRPEGLTGTRCGSLFFQAPEIMQGEEYDPFACDIWSLGCTFCAMLDGDDPWRSESVEGAKEKIAVGRYTIGSDIPDNIKDLIAKMIVVDPRKRITISEVVYDPVFAKVCSTRTRPPVPRNRLLIKPIRGRVTTRSVIRNPNLSSKCGSIPDAVLETRKKRFSFD
jgi:serine/threonine protein kinase